MKGVFVSILIILVLAVAPFAFAQGILIPEHSRVAPFPRPVAGPHPLRVKSLKVETRMQGQVATTRVAQVFENDLDFVVDGTYFYPLPEDATFVEFATWDGEKKLRGEILEKEEARSRYLAIVRRSWDPGLLEYAGLNLFQARVFPVPARGEKRVEFVYSQILKADHGLVSYVYPLQVGAQANPQPIGSLVVSVEIQADQGLKTIYSPTHTLDIHRDGDHKAKVSVEASNTVPDRNFQLFYSYANADFGMSLLTYREAGEDGYFMILLSPKSVQDSGAVLPRDVLFVLDTSGSMQERGKLEKAQAALRFGIRTLNPGDRFNIVTFSTDTRDFRESLVSASEENRTAALAFIERQASSGGTNIDEALKDALADFQPGDRARYLVFLTDGLPTVGESDPGKILRNATDGNRLKVRFFTFGVGYDVNTFLLDQLAARNFGAADYVAPDEDLEVKLSNFFAKVSSPVMTGLALDFGGLGTSDIYPRQLPDLFKGSQITVLGRYTGSGSYVVQIKGTVRGAVRTLRYDSNTFPATSTGCDFLPRLWAMRKVGYLLEQIRINGENSELKNEVIRLAKKYGFVTPYTSYLAADEKDYITRSPMPRPRMPMMMTQPVGGVYTANGREAVDTSVALNSMKTADIAQPAAGESLRRVGSKSFLMKNGFWVDTSYEPGKQLPQVELQSGSEALLKLVVADRDLASYAAIGKNVIFVYKGKVYRIHA